MMSLTFGLFTQVSGSGPLGPLVYVLGVITEKSYCKSSERNVVYIPIMRRQLHQNKHSSLQSHWASALFRSLQ